MLQLDILAQKQSQYKTIHYWLAQAWNVCAYGCAYYNQPHSDVMVIAFNCRHYLQHRADLPWQLTSLIILLGAFYLNLDFIASYISYSSNFEPLSFGRDFFLLPLTLEEDSGLFFSYFKKNDQKIHTRSIRQTIYPQTFSGDDFVILKGLTQSSCSGMIPIS